MSNARAFGKVSGVLLVSGLIASVFTGPIGIIAMLVACYFLLSYTNQLDRRDAKDRRQAGQRKRRNYR